MTPPTSRLLLPLVAVLACGPVREELTLDQICVVANVVAVGGPALVADQPMRVTIGLAPSRTCRTPCDTHEMRNWCRSGVAQPAAGRGSGVGPHPGQ